jgi:hypothetical protein
MPGIPTHFRVLDLTLAQLRADGLDDLVDKVEQNREWAYLGSIGALLLDFAPAQPSQNPYAAIWQRVFALVSDDKASNTLGLLSAYQVLKGFLDSVEAAANARNSDQLAATETFLAKAAEATDAFGSLAVRINNLLKDSLQSIQELRPAVERPGSAPPAAAWRLREFFFWKKPGAFLKALIDQAVLVATVDADKAAKGFSYAFGFLTFYATSVCTSPFVNSIVGGPYRTQWWRHRWINNHVDTWVFGYYEAGKPAFAQDPLDSDYLTWPDLCGQNLQRNIELGDIVTPAVLQQLCDGQSFDRISPDFDAFGAFWFNAVKQTFGSSALSKEQWASTLNDACVFTWLVLWLQTSGEVIRCEAPPKAPDNCGDLPSWSNPAIPGDAGAGSGPPTPQSEQPDNSASNVSGVIAAILGVISLLSGALPLAAGAIGFGIGAAVSRKSVDWDKVLCDVYYYRVYLYNINNAVRSIATAAGLMYPPPSALGNEIMGQLSTQSARNVAKASSPPNYPAAVWDGFSNFQLPPLPGAELPGTIPSSAAGRYPNFVIDFAANPLTKGRVRNPGVGTGLPATMQSPLGDMQQMDFGNAVANAVDLIKAVLPTLEPDGTRPLFPDWNLDADRGQAYLTWQFRAGTGGLTSPVQIEREV